MPLRNALTQVTTKQDKGGASFNKAMQYSSHILSHIVVVCIYIDISQLNLYQHYVINNQRC